MIDHGYSLQNLQNLSTDNTYYQQHFDNQNIRNKAVAQAAESLGMQSGLYYESQQIDSVLMKHASNLDKVFNFGILMYQNNVLPPVIVKASNTVHINSDQDTMRIAGQTYRIIKQVRFVTAQPTWRDYLWMSYPKPEMPNRILLPKNDIERASWQVAVTNGWNEGIKQAMSIYRINLHRLVRDYNGMVLYKSLLLKNMVSPFFVTKTQYGITGNGSHMAVDDQSWRITTKPELQLHSKLWNPVVRTDKQNGKATD